jgi:hypothetical protein
MQEDLGNLKLNEVRTLVEQPNLKKYDVIDTRWLFRNKQDEDMRVVS